jgi:hypothetical protein
MHSIISNPPTTQLTNRHSPRLAARLRRLLFPLLTLFCLLAVQPPGPGNAQSGSAAPPNAPSDTPIPVVNETYNEFTLNSGLLYWAERCYGGEFVGPGYLRRLPVNGGFQITLANVDSAHCLTYLDMAADSDGIYYFDESDMRIESRASGSPTTATTVYSLTAELAPVGERLALDGGYVYWLANTQLLRVRADGTDFGTVATGLNTPTDLIATNGTVYWLESSGLWRTTVSCGTLPCAPTHLSNTTGSHLLYYYQFTPLVQAGPRLLWVAGAKIHRLSCSSITILCSETDIYTAPNDGNPWELGRPASDGTDLFWEEGYFNVPGAYVGRLRRMPLGGGTAVDIATNLYFSPGPVYVDTNYVYFPSVDNSSTTNPTTDILKLPLNASALVRDLAANAIEVTQGIQNLADDTPLVAQKTTYVRAFALDNSGPDALSVDAYLYGSRSGVQLPGSPLHPIHGKVALHLGATYVRAQLDSGWLFQLPESWTQQGTVDLRLVVDPLQTYSDPNRANNELTRSMAFNNRQTVCNIFIPVHTNAPLPSTNIANFWQMIDYAQRLWPTASFQSYQQDDPLEKLTFCSWHGIPYPCTGPYTLPGDTWELFTDIGFRDVFTSTPNGCNNTHFVGMVHPSTDTGITTGTGMTAVFNYAWVKFSNDLAAPGNPFAPESGETLAHEIAHNQGRQHVDCGGPDDPDPNYPYPTDQIDNVGNSNHYGFDVRSLIPIPPNGAKDFMSYCTPKWTSDYTWKALFNSLALSPVPGLAPLSAAPSAGTNQVLVSGAVTPTENSGTFGYAWNLPTSTLNAQALAQWQQSSSSNSGNVPKSPTATYHIRLLDAGGNILLDQPVAPTVPDIHNLPSPAQVFLAAFPAPSGTVAKIELLQDNTVLFSRSPGTHVPTVKVLQPAGGEVITDQLNLSWQAQDADPGDVLHYSIQYSPDNGATWRSLATNVTGLPGSSTVNLNLHPNGIPGSLPNGALIRVAASDGYNTGTAVSKPFTVSNRKPEAFILTPAPGENTPAGMSAQLRGAAMDAEDGSLSGGALTWMVDGQAAGSGEQVELSGRAPGAYPVVLTAHDSLSQTGTAQATLTILPLAVPSAATPSLDGLCDDASYANASQVLLKPYASGDQASLHLLQDGGALWACFSGLKPGAQTPGAQVGLQIDVNHSRDNLTQPGDYAFLVGEDGSVLTLAGDGAGGFKAPGPGGLQARIYQSGSAWSAELRIDAAQIGGLNHIVGLLAGHFSVSAQNDNYLWPYAGQTSQPKTWGTTVLAALPAIDQLNPSSAALGDPSFTLVISGENFLPGAQVLWNGTVLAAATVSSSTVITASVGAAQLNAAGNIPVIVRNPGDIDSGAAIFTVHNPQPAISALLPGSTRAAGPAFTLQVNGSHFVQGAEVLWNGQAMPTTFVNDGQLKAQIDRGQILSGQAAAISVLNPDPSAGVSNTALFAVQPDYRQLLPLVVR